mmetsp:Transcript_70654/g.117357  ORF Transcript_70654/g.117357 Transcript_70654/m.117357 type:complete len:258 (+) Transcript_70654:258-1031(+)|eukprot:CAMPEP_0119319986 /NCGR_PEP_ID=MMETSP1333-20130426/51074_1 /TAXON_ID=418940 /ORGANISM="Scyphosphaera apsteinii, Strain RCC1455" /LENGTH=257 /DNA_ID=CAMNT_0007326569 /DNA_START=254 /DNA_END=1027 /DNA_ORIENTATION=+
MSLSFALAAALLSPAAWIPRGMDKHIQRDLSYKFSYPQGNAYPKALSAVMSSSDIDTARLAALSLPTEPSNALSPTDVVTLLCRGLQHAHVPTANAGLYRLHNFCTYECRASLTAREGYKSGPERFVQKAMLWALPGCHSFEIVSEPTIIPGTQTRGTMASMAVEVCEQVCFYYRSGHERDGASAREVWVDPLQRGIDGGGSGGNDNGKCELRCERYLFQLTQERRPPLAGCWLVSSLMPAREMYLSNGQSSQDIYG